MKKVLKIVGWSLLAIIIAVDIFVTVYLLNFNNFAVSQIGKYTFLVIDEKVADFDKNDLVIVKKNDNKEIEVGDYIFFYDVKSKENVVNYGKVNSVFEVNEKESTFTMSDNLPLSSQYVIGKSETASSFAYLGLLLSVLSSQWGFLFLVIFPILILFLYQINVFILELQAEKKQTKNKKEKE